MDKEQGTIMSKEEERRVAIKGIEPRHITDRGYESLARRRLSSHFPTASPVLPYKIVHYGYCPEMQHCLHNILLSSLHRRLEEGRQKGVLHMGAAALSLELGRGAGKVSSVSMPSYG